MWVNDLKILIPNYNGANFLSKTISNIRRIIGTNIEIVVVDDNSTDNSVDVLSKLKVTLLKRHDNGGFAASVNTGLNYCLKNNTKLILVFNSDAMLPNGFLSSLKNHVYPLNPNIAVWGFHEKDEEVIKNNANVSGFVFLLNAKVINEVGYLDEEFFMYGEEQEYFRRLVSLNYKIIQTKIEIAHSGEGSSLKNFPNFYFSYLAQRNSILLEIKTRNIFFVLRKVLVIFLIINKLYFPKGRRNDTSYKRITRPNFFLRNIFFIKSIIYNVQYLFDRSEH